MKSARVQGFVLDRGGLWKNIMGKGPELIKPIERTEDKFERDFLPKPIRRKLVMRIENTGMVKILTSTSNIMIIRPKNKYFKR